MKHHGPSNAPTDGQTDKRT